MKVLITTDLYDPTINGVVTSVKNLTYELMKYGHEVRIITVSQELRSYRRENVYYMRSIPLYVYPGIRMPVSYHNRYIKEIVEWKPDIIHSQCEFFSYQYAISIREQTGAPIVHTYHTLYEQYAKYAVKHLLFANQLIGLLSKARLRKAKCIIAPTGKVEDALRNYGVNNSIHVVPTGISLQQFEKRLSKEEVQKRKKDYGIPEGCPVLLSLGRVGFEKNIDELVDHFAHLVTDGTEARLLIVGGGPAENSLKQQVRDLGLEDKVIFTGMVPKDKVQEYYQLGDVFICASTSETQGLTYVEAMANELPLVCRRDPCLNQVIVEGVNGYQYDTQEDFLRYIHLILQHPSWMTEAVKSNRNRIHLFSKENFASSMEEIYEAVIKEEQ